MKNNVYSLQLLNHSELFSTREEAKAYIDDFFKPDALLAEPAVVFYGEAKSPNMILAFGSGDRKVFTIDSAKLAEDIAALKEEGVENQEQIDCVVESLKNLIEVCGLTYDDNKKSNQISYNPDPKDTLIADAESLSQAIDLISKFVQKGLKDSKISIADTRTVKLAFTDDENGGKVLKAAVKISKDGEDDDVQFNNNIIGVKQDGVFASVNLEYDDVKHELVFSTSGIRNNRFVDDANKKVIPLGEHKQYDAANTGHTIKITTDKENNTISADAKISEDETNILSVQDGQLYVDGRAKNIKYKGTTVYGGLNALEESVTEIKESVNKINDTHYIEGEETDTMAINATRTPLGYHHISGNVRLGENRSIKVENGGLVADVDLVFDAANNELTFTVGNETKTIKLNGVDLVTDIYYDSANKEIVVVTKSGTLRVSVSDLFKTWDVNNKANSPIELTKTTSPDPKTPDMLSANVRLASTDNILEVIDGKLVAKESKITNAVETEKQRAMAAETELRNTVNANNTEANAKIEEIKGNVTGNANAIAAEQARAEAAEAALNTAITGVSNNVARIDGSLAETIADVDSLTLRVQDSETNIAANGTKIANNTAAIAQNTTDLTNLRVSLTAANKEIEKHIETVDLELASVKDKNTEQDNSLSANATAIEDEKERALAKEAELNTAVNAVKSDLALEKEQRAAADNAFTAKDADLQAQITAMGTSTGTNIADTLAQAKAYTDAEVDKLEVSTANNIASAKNDAITAAAADATAKANTALADAKAYTNAEVEKHKVSTSTDIANAKREAIDTAATDATAKANAALADAKAYSDAEKERAMAAEAANKGLIDGLTAKDIELENSLKLKIESVSIVKDSVSDLQYILYADGKKAGEINIPQDQFLKNVTYNEASKELEFTFTTSEGDNVTKVNIADLVDTYTAGNGLNLEGNVFSLKLSAATESYLTLDGNGLKLSGIDAALNGKANVGDAYTKAEADSIFLKEHQSLEALATKEELNATNGNVTANANAIATEKARAEAAEAALDGKIDTNKAAIGILNGNEATEGSVANAVKLSKEYSDGKLAEAIGAVDEKLDKKVEKVSVEKNSASDLQYLLKVDDANAGTIDIPGAGEGLAMKEGKFVAKVDSASESYLTVSAEGIKLAGLNEKLAEKANVGDAYTKAEADGKFLTEHQDISSLATKAEVAAVEEEAEAVKTAVEGAVDANAAQDTRLDNLEAENARRSLRVQSSDTVNMVLSKNDDGTVISSGVRLKNSVTNILKNDAEGIFANVTFDYNSATNTITFSNGLETRSFQLSGESLVTGGSYDSNNKLIILTIQNSDGSTSNITIPVNDLVDTFDVENTPDNPIQLAKATKDGKDVISASINISNAEHNGIIRESGALYASKDAKDMTALWGSTHTTIQAALNEIKGKTDKVDEISSDVNTLKTDVSQAKLEITDLKGKVADNATKIGQLENNFNALDSEFDDVKGQFTQLQGNFNLLETRVTLAETKVRDMESAVEAMQSTVDDLKNAIGEVDPDAPTVNERLAAIEAIVFNLIDFGTYENGTAPTE